MFLQPLHLALQLEAATGDAFPLGPGRDQFLSLQVDHLSGLHHPTLRLSHTSFKLSPRHVGIRKFLPARIEFSPQFGHGALRVAHLRPERIDGQLKIDHFRFGHGFQFAASRDRNR